MSRSFANRALDIAFAGDTTTIDADMAALFDEARADLLAALELAVEYDGILQSHAGPAVLFEGDVAAIDAAYDKWISAARAAIAKVEGAKP